MSESKETSGQSHEKAIRKKRLTQKEIQDFALWAIKENVFDKYSSGRIQQLYKELKGIELSTCTIRLQKNRWIMIDGKVYDKTKPYLIPKKTEN